MNLKKTIILTLLLFLSIGVVYGGGGETSIEYPQYNDITYYQDIIYAEEDGHFDIQFSDDYKGYCFEYGEEEATKGDKFYAEQTDYLLNTDGEDVSNLLKVYFVYYYNETQKDPVVTQHTIWHFTDNFDGWRVNKTLVGEIKDTSLTNTVYDTGKFRYNDTHMMHYDFKSLVSPYEAHQNFFAYKILFKPIDDCIVVNNTTVNNITNNYYNITNEYYNITVDNHTENNYYINNTTNIINNSTNNHNYIYINNNTITQKNYTNHIMIIMIKNYHTYLHNLLFKSSDDKYSHHIIIKEKNNNNIINLTTIKTGNAMGILILILIILSCATYQIYRK